MAAAQGPRRKPTHLANAPDEGALMEGHDHAVVERLHALEVALCGCSRTSNVPHAAGMPPWYDGRHISSAHLT